AYGICLDSQSRGYLGKDRKVSSAAGGNLSRMHKTQETAKESRLNFMYSHLRNRTLAQTPSHSGVTDCSIHHRDVGRPCPSSAELKIAFTAEVDRTQRRSDPALRLDAPKDRERLSNTVQVRQPHLLILDPLIRLHRVDENDASQIAALLSYLRQLQRTFHVAVLVVHHARKDANAIRPGQALRGSSELHGWGDSNLYMRRRGDQLTLSTEHRAAASQDHIPLQLTQTGSALALSVASDSSIAEPDPEPSALQRVHQILAGLDQPVTV